MLTRFVAAGLLVLGMSTAEAQQPASSSSPMKCETGPVKRSFGGSSWIVYSCDDLTSIVVVSAEGNPASPFYFLLKSTGGAYKIMGEGNGDKKASDAAGDELSRMTPAELAGILAATRTAPPGP